MNETLPGAYGPATVGYLSGADIEARRAKNDALEARTKVEHKLYTTVQALLAHGNNEDVDAATAAVAKVAAKAMRRR